MVAILVFFVYLQISRLVASLLNSKATGVKLECAKFQIIFSLRVENIFNE